MGRIGSRPSKPVTRRRWAAIGVLLLSSGISEPQPASASAVASSPSPTADDLGDRINELIDQLIITTEVPLPEPVPTEPADTTAPATTVADDLVAGDFGTEVTPTSKESGDLAGLLGATVAVLLIVLLASVAFIGRRRWRHTGTDLVEHRNPEPRNGRGETGSVTPRDRVSSGGGRSATFPWVRAVELRADWTEVLLACPDPLPLPGWSTTDGGISWINSSTITVETISSTLVPIGRRSDPLDGDIYLDLATAGTTSLIGDRSMSESVMSGLVAAFVSGNPETEVTAIDGTVLPVRHIVESLTECVRSAERHNSPHAYSAPAARMLVIVASGDLDEADGLLLDRLVELSVQNRTITTLIVGDYRNATERIGLNSENQCCWARVELSTAEPSISPIDVSPAEPDSPQPTNSVAPEGPDDSNHTHLNHVAYTQDRTLPSHDPDELPESLYVPPRFDLIVRTMGTVHVAGADLTSDECELVTLLGCLRHREDLCFGLIHESVGPDRAKKTIENRISRLRQKLGTDSLGNDMLPDSIPGTLGRGRYVISQRVVTDLELLDDRLAVADALSSSDALEVLAGGLDLMTGPLFRCHAGFDYWPHTEGVIADATALVQIYATRLIELAGESNNAPLVVRTATAAGRVLDDPIAQIPFRQAVTRFAHVCADPALHASIEQARQHLLEHLMETDRADDLEPA